MFFFFFFFFFFASLAKAEFAPANNAPWTTVLDKDKLFNTKLWANVKKAATTLFPLETGEYMLIQALAYVIRWGDHLTIDGGDPDTKVCMFFFS